MTLRRLDLLIDIVRQSTDYKDFNGIAQSELIEYFNDAQEFIQGVIFSSDIETNLFLKEFFIDANMNQEFYDLPEDMFAENAIFYVEEQSSRTGVFHPIMKINPLEKKSRRGYYVQNRKISFSPSTDFNTNDQWKITYFATLPRVSTRAGVLNNKIVDDPSTLVIGGLDEDTLSLYDYISFVDFDGNILLDNIRVLDVQLGNSIITDTDISSVPNGSFLAVGKISTTHCRLPEYCQSMLLDYVRARLYARASSGIFNSQSVFSQTQLDALVQVFSHHSKDVLYPPSTDTDYLGY